MKATSLLLAATALAGCATATPAEAARRTSAPQVRIGDATANEADGQILFIATRSVCTGTSSITYRTIDGTAVAGSDYVAAGGTATWGSGQCSTTIPITLVGGTTTEPTEQFTVKIRAGTNVKLSDSSAIGKITDSPPVVVPPTEEEEPPETAPDPTTKLCSDGSEIPIEDDCPIETPERDPTLGLIDIASEFSYTLSIENTSGVATKSAAPDVVGAFRFVCSAGKLGYIDPIVNPGTASGHLHQFYGNESVTKDSTYATLRAAGKSTCGDDTSIYPANRSAYWMPAMLDGRGNVIKPDYVLIYYKRRPVSDPKCSLSSGDSKAEGNCVNLPNGLKFIWGFDMITGQPPTGETYYTCKGTGAIPGRYANLAQVVGKCPAGAQVGAITRAPNCWDGKNLDSSNHRNHVAYHVRDPNTGINKCPSTHPYVIPAFTLHAWYRVQSADNLSLWSLSSDAMHPTLPNGSTFHADFFMAWDPTIKGLWHDNCINLLLNCSAGDLGNGKKLKGQSGPVYNGVTSWTNPNPRVAVPTP